MTTKSIFTLTMDTLSAFTLALVLGIATAFVSYLMDGPEWLTNGIGWTVFGGTGVGVWTWLRSLHESPRDR